MPFVVRDLARDIGKRVQLEIAGQSTEIDKFLIERMMDPMLHLVRNAVSHGIETPEQRVAAGKPPEGTIRLSASTVGESVIIEIADDGAGIDLAAVAQRARAKGVHTDDGALDSRLLLDIICASGFSTRDEADRVSGRGVGMAVVREHGSGAGRHAGRGHRAGTRHHVHDHAAADAGGHRRDHRARRRSDVRRSAVGGAGSDRGRSGQPPRRSSSNELLTYRGGRCRWCGWRGCSASTTAPRPRLHAIVVGTGLSAVGPAGRPRRRAARDCRQDDRRSADSRRRRVRGDRVGRRPAGADSGRRGAEPGRARPAAQRERGHRHDGQSSRRPRRRRPTFCSAWPAPPTPCRASRSSTWRWWSR